MKTWHAVLVIEQSYSNHLITLAQDNNGLPACLHMIKGKYSDVHLIIIVPFTDKKDGASFS